MASRHGQPVTLRLLAMVNRGWITDEHDAGAVLGSSGMNYRADRRAPIGKLSIINNQDEQRQQHAQRHWPGYLLTIATGEETG